MTAYPERPPRVRVEWLVAGTRVVLAGGALLAVALEPFRYWSIAYLLAWYLVWSLAVLALVWTPTRFARGWDVAVHLFDLAVFSLLMLVTQGATSPFFVYFIFLLVCGTLRWQVRGTLWTAAATIAAYAGASVYAVNVLHLPGFELNTFVIRTVYLSVITVLLGYLGAHQNRFQHEISRIAAWPRRISRDPREVVSEVIAHTRALLDAPELVLVWQEAGEGWVNVAWRSGEEIQWTHEPEEAYGSFVLPGLERKSFQASDVTQERGRVLTLTSGGFRRRDCRPINEALRARFEMRAVQSWPLDGELIRGRMFCLNKPQMRIDDLILGELVAQLAVSRLESLYLLNRLRQSSALEERVRVARELHDNLLQSQAGAALQLLAARRSLGRDPDTARARLEEVQRQLEHDEIEMRSFIRGLRPARVPERDPAAPDLSERLETLRERVQRQWEIEVRLGLHGAIERLPDGLTDEVYRLAQEGMVNAARHAHASVISVALSVTEDDLKLEVVDDGRGFPFQGTYDLASLDEMNKGPLTLRERVAQLDGDLTLKSMDTGTALLMRLPFAQLSTEANAY